MLSAGATVNQTQVAKVDTIRKAWVSFFGGDQQPHEGRNLTPLNRRVFGSCDKGGESREFQSD